MKLKFCTFLLYFLILFFKVKIPAVQPKKRKECSCDDCRTVDPPSLLHQGKIRESLPVVSEVEILSFFSLENAILWASQLLAMSSTLYIFWGCTGWKWFLSQKDNTAQLSALNTEVD